MYYEEYNGYYVGQEVVIRSWDDLANEFGVIRNIINCNGLAFTSNMRRYCGQVFTIKQLTTNRVRFYEKVDYEFNYEMVMPYEEPDDEDPDILQAFTSGIEAFL